MIRLLKERKRLTIKNSQYTYIKEIYKFQFNMAYDNLDAPSNSWNET